MANPVTNHQHRPPSQTDQTLENHKAHVRLKMSQITGSVLLKSSTSAKEPKWFKKILSSYKTLSLQEKMHSSLQSDTKDVLFEVLQSSSSQNLNKQISSQISLHDKRKEDIKFISYHNIFPGKRRKRSVQVGRTSSGEKDLDNSENTQMFATSETKGVHITKREVEKNLNKTTKPSQNVGAEVNGPEKIHLPKTSLPFEWTPEGNYSAAWKIWKKYSEEKTIVREAQIAFMSTVFLLCLLSWAVWVTGMCHRRKVKYREWNFQESHATVTMADILKRRWKYLPEESFYEEVIVHDRGTDP